MCAKAKVTGPSRQATAFTRWDDAWSRDVPAQQRLRMARVRSKDTAPELTVRRLAHRLGYRFRLHDRRLPGRPDLVFPRLRKLIEVRGCFWHAHSCQRRKRRTVRPEYWRPKLARNVARDRRNIRKLRRLGWRVLVVWECQTQDEETLSARLGEFLST